MAYPRGSVVLEKYVYVNDALCHATHIMEQCKQAPFVFSGERRIGVRDDLVWIYWYASRLH